MYLQAALSRRSEWSWSPDAPSEAAAAALLSFLAAHAPRLRRAAALLPPNLPPPPGSSSPPAGDAVSNDVIRPSPMNAAVARLAAGCPLLTQVTLVNVDVGDAALAALAARCPQLRHLAVGRCAAAH